MIGSTSRAESTAAMHDAIEHARRLGDTVLLCRALSNGLELVPPGSPEGRAMRGELLEASRRVGIDKLGASVGLLWEVAAAYDDGDLAAMRRAYTEGEQWWGARDDDSCWVLGWQANYAFEEGRLGDARERVARLGDPREHVHKAHSKAVLELQLAAADGDAVSGAAGVGSDGRKFPRSRRELGPQLRGHRGGGGARRRRSSVPGARGADRGLARRAPVGGELPRPRRRAPARGRRRARRGGRRPRRRARGARAAARPSPARVAAYGARGRARRNRRPGGGAGRGAPRPRRRPGPLARSAAGPRARPRPPAGGFLHAARTASSPGASGRSPRCWPTA